jgi:hypothetical protein
MEQKILHAFSKSLFDTDLVASRVILAMAEFIWALLLMWPGETFSRPTYSLMSHVMSEESWSLVFLLTAVSQTTIVLAEFFHSTFARVFAGWNAALWLFVVTSMLLSVYPPPAAISGEIALAAAAFWIWVRPYILFHGVVNARSARG